MVVWTGWILTASDCNVLFEWGHPDVLKGIQNNIKTIYVQHIIFIVYKAAKP